MFAPLVLVVALALQAEAQAAPQTDSSAPTSSSSGPIASNGVPQPDADGIYHIRKYKDISAPRLLNHVYPKFTKEARKRKVSGQTVIGLIVDTQGNPTKVHVVTSMADKITNEKDRSAALSLDQAAVEAVSQYRFEPAKLNGNPIPVELKVEVNFQLF